MLHYTSAHDGGPEMLFFDAVRYPDRKLLPAGFFAAEGSLVVRQLLQLPGYTFAALLCTENMLQTLSPELAAYEARMTQSSAAAAVAASKCIVYTANKSAVATIIGFKMTALSVVGLLHKPPATSIALSAFLPTLAIPGGGCRRVLLVLDKVNKPDNMGALFRSALAFGASGVLLGPGCCDPLVRKCIRASMGAVFKLPYAHAKSWPADLNQLRAEGFHLWALHLEGSVVLSDALADLRATDGTAGEAQSVAVMVGAEYEGLGEEAAACADERVRIRMSGAMDATLDSVNVNVAASVVLERLFNSE